MKQRFSVKILLVLCALALGATALVHSTAALQPDAGKLSVGFCDVVFFPGGDGRVEEAFSHAAGNPAKVWHFNLTQMKKDAAMAKGRSLPDMLLEESERHALSLLVLPKKEAAEMAAAGYLTPLREGGAIAFQPDKSGKVWGLTVTGMDITGYKDVLLRQPDQGEEMVLCMPVNAPRGEDAQKICLQVLAAFEQQG